VAAYFLDASALVKRYVTEKGTPWVTGLLDPAARNRLYVARITGVEITAALTRKERRGRLSAAAANLCTLFVSTRLCEPSAARRDLSGLNRGGDESRPQAWFAGV